MNDRAETEEILTCHLLPSTKSTIIAFVVRLSVLKYTFNMYTDFFHCIYIQ